MNKRYAATIVSFLLVCLTGIAFGQQTLVNDVKKRELEDFSARLTTLYQASHTRALALAPTHNWFVRRQIKNGGIITLQGVNKLGFPIYLRTDNNIIAAATTGTNLVQPGGSLNLNLSGSSTALNGKLAIWDGGSVYAAHQEFAGKTITIHDNSGIIDHATHVSGTMLAKGVYAPAKGMAFNASTLQSYDFDNDVAEMTKAASGLLLSNHSYGDIAGWDFDDVANQWDWYGLPGDTVDYKFGFYDERTMQFDSIAFSAPHYLIVESAGNSRAYNGPDIGQDYYGFKSLTDQTFVDKGPRPATISSNSGYDIIATTGNAKNILTVGAINPLPYGPSTSSAISIASFSSWGPTDDGRVKPDIVGDGVNLLSTGSSSPTSYIVLSGTSMSAPNVTGSLYLLQEYYEQQNNGKFMRAATLKGLACHTAFDAGNVGPDYIYGWGLLDMKKAAQALADNGTKSLVQENILQQGAKQTFNVTASGNGVLAATISWTDPAGTPTAEGTINSRVPKLVNDLDIRVSDGTNIFLPWILDPDNPSAAAKTGDNHVDNVEQVYVAGAVAGRAYTITVTNKGTLKGGSQNYSLIVTGIGGAAYCASGPLSNADSRVNNVTFSNINYTQTSGCTTYSDHTNLTAQLEQGKTYPLSITLGTCGANFNKAAKVYIDYNNDGVFEANELVATTGIINATGTYSTNVTIPATVVPGNYSIMRVVLTETGDTSVIKPCGNYAKGETQDYRVQFLQTSIDAGITAIVNPAASGSCAGTPQVTVTLKNYGGVAISNIPVTVNITAPDNTVTTIKQTYTGTLQPLEEDNFTLNSTFNAVAGATYTIVALTSLAGDAVSTNNQATQTVVVSQPPTPGNLSAYYCVDSKQYQLAGSGDGELLWYQNIGDATPLAYGSPALVTSPPVNNTYYAGLNDFTGTVGPANKNVFTGGGYNQFTPYVTVTTKIPVVIQSARLYIGNSGKITFTVGDVNGETVSSTTIDAIATRTNPQPGAVADDPNDPGAVYNLNLLLPAAGTYYINISYDNNATIYRNNKGITGYPFTAGGIFSITGNGASDSATDTTTYKGYYYYFYDMKVKSAGCASAARQPVVISKPMITQSGTVLSSNFTSENQWYSGSGQIAGATNATYTPTKSGTYSISVTLANGCRIVSDSYVYVMPGGGKGSNSDIGLVIFPIPANNLLNVVFGAKNSDNLTLTLINAAGQTVYTSQQTVTAGNIAAAINVANIPAGSYVLKLLLGQKSYDNKVVIAR